MQKRNELRKSYITELKEKQSTLMKELSLTKKRLMIDDSQWSFDRKLLFILLIVFFWLKNN